MTQHRPRTQSSPMGRQMLTAVGCRFLLNTARRFAYPFAPALSRGLQVPLTDVTALIALNQITGLLAVAFGPLSDRFGYRWMMLTAMVLLAAGMLTCAAMPVYTTAGVALFLGGLGKNLFDPAVQAHVGHHVPFARRGLFIGVMEISWAASSLIGLPVAGLLIDSWGWRAPFAALGIGGAIGAVAVICLVPKPVGLSVSSITDCAPQRRRSHWRLLVRSRPVMGALGYAFFSNLAIDAYFIVSGIWFESDFGLSVAALGAAAVVVGIAELAGEGLVLWFSDRIGLVRAVKLGILATLISYSVLPWCGDTIGTALAGLFMIFLCFEFTIVTSMSLFTELIPPARATMMAVFFASAGLGRMTGAAAGPFIWAAGRLDAMAVVCATCSAIALAWLVWGLRGWQPGADHDGSAPG